MRKIGSLCLALVLALGTLGIGYAQWTEALTIGGTVTTGDLDVRFTSATSTPGAPDGTALIAEGGKSVTWTVVDAYPGQAINLVWTIENEGSVPALVTLTAESIAAPLEIATPDLAVTLLPGEIATRTTTVTVPDVAIEDTIHALTVDIVASTP